ncbi:branched-chain amino acid ABC transporter ATP-binding protein/permease [Blastococcus tunisiensis]|uniref:Branched-chain amino acid transport system permease protein n=1 Tax=Blastococcus tunisiensis TaxID=1798228 RepID=A0A1I2EEN3_9ACTN|nr:ATP-binding cassette domain-containing protein [Blastococcus sp. DSM 46838]SFE91133.1 branched-chain amino acid transport system permease protein [Blastococcus sp. DSM 46838]
MIAALRRRVGRGHALALVGAALALAAAPFLLLPYPLTLLTLALVYGLFAFGLDIAWGRAGVVSIGHAAFFGLGAYGAAIASARDIPVLLGVAGGVVAALVLALVIGLAGLGRRALASTMAVLTLALTLAVSQGARSWTGLTNGSNGLVVLSDSGVVGTYYRTAGIVLGTVVVVWLIVLRGSLGRRFVAIRLNQQRAEHLGIDPWRTKLIALLISAGISALAGAVAAPVIGLISPSISGIVMSTEVLVWLAVGGLGTITGAFLGAGLVTIGNQLLGDVIGSWYLLMMGVLFLLVVRFAPEGLVGVVRSVIRRPLREKAAGGAVLAGTGAPPPDRSTATAGGPVLRARDVEKDFGPVPVIQGIDLDVAAGEVVCLIGPNGAGKTTFLAVLAGEHVPERGRVWIAGRDVTARPAHERARMGLGRMFQIPSVFLELTPAQNLALARAEGVHPPAPLALYDRFTSTDDMLAKDLPLADRRALELAMALSWGPEILLLDEPAAGLSHEDSVALARTLREVAERTGCTLVAVEHDMEIVRELADRVVVLADGRILVEGSMDEVSAHDEVRRAYLGVA